MKLVRTFRTFALATAVAAGALSLGACGGQKEAKTANVTPGSMPSGERWSGVYYHPVFGHLHLQEQGSNIVGRWKRTDQSHWGELSGTVNGNVLHYTWKEHKVGMIGPAATTRGRGYFVYSVNDQNIGELDGEFGLNDSEVGSSWKNVKQANQAPDLQSIGGDAEALGPGQL